MITHVVDRAFTVVTGTSSSPEGTFIHFAQYEDSGRVMSYVALSKGSREMRAASAKGATNGGTSEDSEAEAAFAPKDWLNKGTEQPSSSAGRASDAVEKEVPVAPRAAVPKAVPKSATGSQASWTSATSATPAPAAGDSTTLGDFSECGAGSMAAPHVGCPLEATHRHSRGPLVSEVDRHRPHC